MALCSATIEVACAYSRNFSANVRKQHEKTNKTKAAELHESAAKSHRAAAEAHGKNDHAKGKEHATQRARAREATSPGSEAFRLT
jgi:hypothetical protein